MDTMMRLSLLLCLAGTVGVRPFFLLPLLTLLCENLLEEAGEYSAFLEKVFCKRTYIEAVSYIRFLVGFAPCCWVLRFGSSLWTMSII